MTFEDAAMLMICGGSGGGSGPPTMPHYLHYYDYQTSVNNYSDINGEYIFEDSITVPANSIVIEYYKAWRDKETGYNNYWYKYYVYQLIIEGLDTETEEVVGIIDKQTNKEYRFQFNAKGGR